MPQPAGRRVAKVATGAPVPAEYDAVVKVENVSHDDREVTFTAPACAGEYIREPAEDVHRGQLLYHKGDVLGPLDIGILANIGLREITVYKRPTVLVAATGNELAQPGESLGNGQIYDSNSFTIGALIKPFCACTERIPVLTDDSHALKSALTSGRDVIVTSGGVSVGDRDLVVATAELCGWTTVFHRVRVKPGRPVYFACKGRQLLFGLPGNSLSAAVTCAVFVIPALKKMVGYREFRICPVPARLNSPFVGKLKRMLIWPGTIRRDGDETVAELSAKESSAALSALQGTDGLVFVGNQDKPDTASTVVRVVPWQQILVRWPYATQLGQG